MQDIFATLVQAIEENAFPLSCAQPEYRQNQHYAEKHRQWLEENLGKEAKEHLEERLTDEEKAHLETLRQAELRIASLECEAEVRLALAAGVRLALAS